MDVIRNVESFEISQEFNFCISLLGVFFGQKVDVCLFIPCFPAFFDLLMSRGSNRTQKITLKNGSIVLKWPKGVGVSYTQQNRFNVPESGLTSLNIDKETLLALRPQVSLAIMQPFQGLETNDFAAKRLFIDHAIKEEIEN